MQYPAIMQPTRARILQVSQEEEEDAASKESSTTFPPVSLKVARNFYVADTYYEGSRGGVSAMAYEEADPADMLAAFKGLGAVSDDIKSLLPPECKKAFDVALGKEDKWKAGRGTESDNMHRTAPVIDKAIVPYSVMQ